MKNATTMPAPFDLPPQPEDDPNELPYPGHARELAAIDKKASDAMRSRSVALPGPLRETFAGEPRRLHGFTLQPVNAWLVAILTRIESPLIEIIRIWREHAEEMQDAFALKETADREKAINALQKIIRKQIKVEIKQRPDDIIEIVYCFVTPVETLQEQLDQDRKVFTNAARNLLGKIHPKQLTELETACEEHYCASFATALSISAAAPDNPGDGSVFCKPPAEPIKTDSAGGSKSPAS